MTERNNILSKSEIGTIFSAFGELSKTANLCAEALVILLQQIRSMEECLEYVLPLPHDPATHRDLQERGLAMGERGVLDVIDPDLYIDLDKEETNGTATA